MAKGDVLRTDDDVKSYEYVVCYRKRLRDVTA